MKQIFHNYQKWEDYINGMWRKETKEYEDVHLKIAIEFTGNDELYGNAMMEVIENWKYTCEHNLSDKSINRKAFIGHCAVCYKLGIPEYITRMAWHYLTQEQQDKANKKAEHAIKQWELKQTNHAKNLFEQ